MSALPCAVVRTFLALGSHGHWRKMRRSMRGQERFAMDTWPRCERAMGFIAMIVGASFLVLSGLVLYQADYSISKGFIALVITGGVTMAVGLFMFLNAGETVH